MDRAVDRAAGRAQPDPRHLGVHAKARHDLDELMSVLQRGDRLGVSELSPLGRSPGVRRRSSAT